MEKINLNRSDPIAYFIQDMEYHGRSKRTQDAYLRVLTDFQLFSLDFIVLLYILLDFNGMPLCSAVHFIVLSLICIELH